MQDWLQVWTTGETEAVKDATQLNKHVKSIWRTVTNMYEEQNKRVIHNNRRETKHYNSYNRVWVINSNTNNLSNISVLMYNKYQYYYNNV